MPDMDKRSTPERERLRRSERKFCGAGDLSYSAAEEEVGESGDCGSSFSDSSISQSAEKGQQNQIEYREDEKLQKRES